jgi:hypothetical protein
MKLIQKETQNLKLLCLFGLRLSSMLFHVVFMSDLINGI